MRCKNLLCSCFETETEMLGSFFIAALRLCLIGTNEIRADSSVQLFFLLPIFQCNVDFKKGRYPKNAISRCFGSYTRVYFSFSCVASMVRDD